MLFLDILRQYLRDVDGSRSPTLPRAADVLLDLPAARRYFLEGLERLEDTADSSSLAPFKAAVLHYRWLRDGRLDRFLAVVASELSSGLCAGAEAHVLRAHVEHAIDVLLDLPMRALSSARRSELKRIVSHASRTTGVRSGMDDIARYALELRAVRQTEVGATLSGIGRVLLGLPESDAIRWVLIAETLQSMGAQDEWRMPRAALEAILAEPAKTFEPRMNGIRDEDGQLTLDDDWPYTYSTIARLEALGAISQTTADDGPEWGYRLRPEFRPILEDVVSPQPTPLSLLAESLIAEERAAISGHATLAAPLSEPAAEIQARHARMVVHEMRNALVPVRTALTEVYRALGSHAPDDEWRTLQDRINRGLDRVFRFVADLQQVARLGNAIVERFDARTAIDDAIKGLNGGLLLDLTTDVSDSLPRLTGSRERFTLVIVNLLRNAAQNSGKPTPKVAVSAALAPDGARLLVTIDDDGPGVPEADRARIFEQGVALRSGGSGQGLALVREVVEVEMKGRARCEQGTLGGARFVLELPVAAKESS